MFTALMIMLAQPIALQCQLKTRDDAPPMFVTLNDDTKTVQVTMAGQTYLEDIISDGPLTFWQVGQGASAIRSRLNRADGTLIIANSGQIVEGNCAVAKSRF